MRTLGPGAGVAEGTNAKTQVPGSKAGFEISLWDSRSLTPSPHYSDIFTALETYRGRQGYLIHGAAPVTTAFPDPPGGQWVSGEGVCVTLCGLVHLVCEDDLAVEPCQRKWLRSPWAHISFPLSVIETWQEEYPVCTSNYFSLNVTLELSQWGKYRRRNLKIK